VSDSVLAVITDSCVSGLKLNCRRFSKMYMKLMSRLMRGWKLNSSRYLRTHLFSAWWRQS